MQKTTWDAERDDTLDLGLVIGTEDTVLYINYLVILYVAEYWKLEAIFMVVMTQNDTQIV